MSIRRRHIHEASDVHVDADQELRVAFLAFHIPGEDADRVIQLPLELLQSLRSRIDDALMPQPKPSEPR